MHDLSSIIGEEIEASRDFLSLLKAEESALAGGDIERLPEIVRTKSAHLQRIAILAQERSRLVPQSEMKTWLDNHPDVRGSWQDLMVLAEAIRQTNETNGKMIDVRLRGTQQALDVLQSLTSSATRLYGPDGQSSVTAGGHSIESA